jgi:N-acetylglucosamine kinase-like BadF-type ATPase
MAYIMGIDQGGSKTDVLIADCEGHIAGFGNDRDWKAITGERRAVRMVRIRYAADKAIREAGIELSNVQSISASCNGADWAFEYEIGRKNIRNTLGVKEVSLYNDCIGALRGGTEIKGRDCAVLCLGTGANCAVINREGKEHIYAYYLKDIHQGAGAIGRFIFQAVYDAEAGLKPNTLLTELLLKQTEYQSVEELYMAVTTGRTETEAPWKPVYKEYCPLLFQAVRMGDRVAANYIEWLCEELAQYVIIGARRLGMENREITLVLSGGVPKSGSIMVDLLQQKLLKHLPGIKCVNARFEPVVGALLLEYDRLYPQGIPEQVVKELESCTGKRNLFRSFITG